jgi:hypothetical protein
MRSSIQYRSGKRTAYPERSQKEKQHPYTGRVRLCRIPFSQRAAETQQEENCLEGGISQRLFSLPTQEVHEDILGGTREHVTELLEP